MTIIPAALFTDPFIPPYLQFQFFLIRTFYIGINLLLLLDEILEEQHSRNKMSGLEDNRKSKEKFIEKKD